GIEHRVAPRVLKVARASRPWIERKMGVAPEPVISLTNLERTGLRRSDVAGSAYRRHYFLHYLMGHEQRAADAEQPEILIVQHAQAKIYLRANRIQIWIESLFGDAESRQPDRQHPLDAPDEKCQRRLGRNDFYDPDIRQHFVGDDQRRFW